MDEHELHVSGSKEPATPDPYDRPMTPELLKSRYVQTLLTEMASALTGNAASQFTVLNISDEIAVVDDQVVYRDVRVSIIGATSLAEISATLKAELLDKSRESLCLCILPSIRQEIWPLESARPEIGAAGVLPMYIADVSALLRKQIRLEELIDYKIFRRIISDRRDPETRYDPRLVLQYRGQREERREGADDTTADLADILTAAHQEWIQHPAIGKISEAIDRARGCLLSGPSSSGKSVLAAQVARNYVMSKPWVRYINLSNIGITPTISVEAFFFADADESSGLLVADDLQSNPQLAKFILALSSTSQRVRRQGGPVVVAVSWPDFAADVARWHENCLPIAVSSSQIRPKLLRRYADSISQDDLDGLAALLGEDLFLLSLGLEQTKKAGHGVTLEIIAAEAWKSRTEHSGVSNNAAERVALVAGSLGRYDIAVAPLFLEHEAHVEAEVITRLIESRLLRRHRGKVTIGHRSLCGLLTEWLGEETEWKSFSQNGPQTSLEVVFDYLQSLGSMLAVDTLRALHARAGFRDKPELDKRAAAVTELWSTFNAAVERMSDQQAKDPTWGKVPSSAMFAVLTFSGIGEAALATSSLEFLRQHWELKDGSLVIEAKDFSTTDDFVIIGEKQKDQDLSLNEALPAGWEPAAQIDLERFHKTWLTGMILCAEGAAQKPRYPLSELAEAAERQRLDSGAFYPSRVPWCTARMLLGLAVCGHNIHTSSSVADSVNWLLRERNQGGARFNGVWESGTGTWNSTLETTALTLLALAAVGYDNADGQIQVARDYLLSMRPHWVDRNQELDGALALQALLETGTDWEDLSSEAQKLARWARDAASWRVATISARESLQQTCRVAQSASHLISIAWSAIRSDLRYFLDALALPDMFRKALQQTRPDAQAQGKPLDSLEDAVLLSVESLPNPMKLSDYTVIGNYRRFDDRARNKLKDWKTRILEALSAESTIRENFLIWAAPGSGKTFFVEEIARSFGDTFLKNQFVTLNLAQDSRDDFTRARERMKATKGSILCLIDEIDARPDEQWPYEACLPILDLKFKSESQVVCVVIGSSQLGLQNMVAALEKRWKGQDLTERVPEQKRFEVPPLTREDQVVIFAANLLSARHDQQINEIERIALYYIISNEALHRPRQLRDLASEAATRVRAAETRLRFNDLFYDYDKELQSFWSKHQPAAAKLSDIYVHMVL